MEQEIPGKPQQQGKGVSPISGVAPPVHSRFVKGQSGNPGGQRKNLSLTAAVNRILVRATRRGRLLPKRNIDVLAEGIFISATKGNAKLAQQIWDRLDQPVVQENRITGSGPGGSLLVQLIEAAVDEFDAAISKRLERGATEEPSGDESGGESGGSLPVGEVGAAEATAP